MFATMINSIKVLLATILSFVIIFGYFLGFVGVSVYNYIVSVPYPKEVSEAHFPKYINEVENILRKNDAKNIQKTATNIFAEVDGVYIKIFFDGSIYEDFSQYESVDIYVIKNSEDDKDFIKLSKMGYINDILNYLNLKKINLKKIDKKVKNGSIDEENRLYHSESFDFSNYNYYLEKKENGFKHMFTYSKYIKRSPEESFINNLKYKYESRNQEFESN